MTLIHLLQALNVPVFAPNPDIAMAYSAKSGSKRIFEAADIGVAPGAHDIYSEADLFTALARLILVCS